LQERGSEARRACNGAESGGSGGRSRRLLIVEDEHLIAQYLADLLEQLGYSVCAQVGSGTAALSAADRDRPDLALVDIGLAGAMDGIRTACLLRQRFDIPSIFVSGTSNAALLARARVARPPGFIQKPFMPDEIERALDTAFARRTGKPLDDMRPGGTAGGKSD
jgi:DNA-binding NarL/FixJ family response regulator